MRSAPNEPHPLRLTLVTETFPPEVNGVARTLGRWVDAFRARGHDVTIIRPRQKRERRAPGLVHGVPVPGYAQLRFGLATPATLRRLLLRARPHLVHVATEGPLGFSALLAAGYLGLPIASSFHTNFDHYFTHYGIPGLEWTVTHYLCWFHNRTAITLVPSEATRTRLESLGVRRVALWSRGVDAGVFHPSHRDLAFRATIGLGDSDVLLLYVGRIAPEKNLGALLAAYTRLLSPAANPPAAVAPAASLPAPVEQAGSLLHDAASSRTRILLAVVGDGPSLPSLRARQLPGVLLPGVQTGADLARWYASADVFAFPSCSETFGNVVLEAQASGLPVVGFDTTGVNERVRDGVDGFLVPMQGDLAGPLRQLCDDCALRRRLGAAGRLSAEQQDWDAIFDLLEQRYRELVQS